MKNAPQEIYFRPQAEITSRNIGEIIAEGRRKVYDGGVLVVDFGNLSESSTLVVCLIIELLRTAHQRKCVLYTQNMQQQQTKLLALYQLSPWIVPK